MPMHQVWPIKQVHLERASQDVIRCPTMSWGLYQALAPVDSTKNTTFTGGV